MKMEEKIIKGVKFDIENSEELEKDVIKGVKFDTKHATEIANNDTEKSASELYRTNKGKYFLQKRKVQARKDGAWRYVLPDGKAYDAGLITRWVIENIELTENQALDWYIATLVPKCLVRAIRAQGGKQDSAWCEIFDYCLALGMKDDRNETAIQMVKRFIRRSRQAAPAIAA